MKRSINPTTRQPEKQGLSTQPTLAEKGKKGYFNSITEWFMREEEIGDNDLFVLPDSPTAIYVTEKFKQRVIEANVTGFGFCKTKYFDDEPFIS